MNDCSNRIKEIANLFNFEGEPVTVNSISGGIINDTYIVYTNAGKKFIMQKVNTDIFSSPLKQISNLEIFLKHLNTVIKKHPSVTNKRRIEFPELIYTKSSNKNFLLSESEYWRSTTFISSSYTIESRVSEGQSSGVGYMLGLFHILMKDISSDDFYAISSNFHDTKKFIKQYYQIADRNNFKYESIKISKLVDYCRKFIDSRASIIEDVNMKSSLTNSRLIHGDPKLNNFIFDKSSNLPVSIVDYDTVGTGSYLHDIGDSFRSICNPLGEDTIEFELIEFNGKNYYNGLVGYSKFSGKLLYDEEYNYIPYSIKLITYELGVRFFTDFLRSNIYFKTTFEHQNLFRACVQFYLINSMEQQWDSLLESTQQVFNAN